MADEDNMKKSLVQKQDAELEDAGADVESRVAGPPTQTDTQAPPPFVPPVANAPAFVQPPYQPPVTHVPLHGQWKDCLCDCCNGGCGTFFMALFFPCCGPCLLSKIHSRISWDLGWTSLGSTPFQQWLRILTFINVVWWIGIFFYEFYAAMAWEQLIYDFEETHYTPCDGHRRGLIGTVLNSVVQTGRRGGGHCYDVQHTTECSGGSCKSWECDLDGCKEWTYDSSDHPSSWNEHGDPIWADSGVHQFTYEAHSPAFHRAMRLFEIASFFEWVTTIINFFFTVIIIVARAKVRQQYLIPASCEEYGGRITCCGVTEDIACSCCCQPCTIAQMARHVDASPSLQCDPCVDPGPAPSVPRYAMSAPGVVPAAPNGMIFPAQVEVGQLVHPPHQGPNNV